MMKYCDDKLLIEYSEQIINDLSQTYQDLIRTLSKKLEQHCDAVDDYDVKKIREFMNDEIYQKVSSQNVRTFFIDVVGDIIAYRKGIIEDPIDVEFIDELNDEEFDAIVNTEMFTEMFMNVLKHLGANIKPDSDDDNAPLGRYAFADKKYDPSPEKDNPTEKRIWKTLFDFFSGEVEAIDRNFIDEIDELIYSNQYQRIFFHSDVDKLYRGMCVQKSWFEHKSESQKMYKPHFIASSWTKDFEIAKKFALENKSDDISFNDTDQGDIVAIVISTDLNVDGQREKTIDCGDLKSGLYSIDSGLANKLARWSKEKEVIVFGNCAISEIEIVG